MPDANDNTPPLPVAPPHPGRDPDAPVPPEQAADAPAPASDDSQPADAPGLDPKPDEPEPANPQGPQGPKPPTPPAANVTPPVDPTHPLTSKLLQIIDDANMLAPILVGILVLAMIFYGRPLVQFMIDPSAARALIGMAISLSTIGLAFVLVFQAFRTSDDKQFQRGREIYGGLIGIFGTIIGFYFGTAGTNPAGPAVEHLRVESQNVAFHVKGGQPPYTATVIAKNVVAGDGKSLPDERKLVEIELNGDATYEVPKSASSADVTVNVQDSANRFTTDNIQFPSGKPVAQSSQQAATPATPGASAKPAVPSESSASGAKPSPTH